MRSSILLSTALAAVTSSACGGSGGGTSSPSPAGTATASATPVTITIVRDNGSQSFSPNPASLGGQLVVFRNSDTVVHHVAFNDGTVDLGDIAPGATSRSAQMPDKGTNYHCSLHPGMIGAVSPAGGGLAPPCAGIYCG